MIDKPEDSLLESFVLLEGAEDPNILKKIKQAWGIVNLKGGNEFGKITASRRSHIHSSSKKWSKRSSSLLPLNTLPSQEHLSQLIFP